MIQQPFPSFCKHNTRPARNVDLRRYGSEGKQSGHEKSYLHKVFPAIPFHWVCEILALRHDVSKPSEASLVTAENNAVLATLVNADPIISEAFGRVEVEDEKQSCSFIDNDFVGFVLQRHICLTTCILRMVISAIRIMPYLWCFKPTISSSELVHREVKVIKVSIAKVFVVENVPLPTGIVEGVSVALAREVKPLGIRVR